MIVELGKLWRSSHRPAVATAGMVLGISLLTAIVLLGWTTARLHEARNLLESEQQAQASAEFIGQELQVLQADLPRREARTRALQAGGMMLPADRVAWAEAIAAAASALRPLTYSAAIDTPQWLPLPDSVSAWYGARGQESPSLRVTDLALQVNGLHEDELLGLLHHALSAAGGIARIEHCDLNRRGDGVGIDASCRLRRFGIGTPTPEELVAAAEVAP